MKNVQISFDEQLLKTIDRFATSSKLTRSAVVREAVKTWIRQKEIKEFEDDWIKKLKEIFVGQKANLPKPSFVQADNI